MKRGFLAAAVLIMALLAVACDSNSARISGTIEGAVGDTMYLVNLSDNVVVDSIMLNKSGKFSFNVELLGGEATLYNMEVGGHKYTIFPSVGDNIIFSATFGEREYQISGSSESELIHEINSIMQGGLARMDAISREMQDSSNTTAKEAYVAEYLATKRAQIRFIVENSGSLSAIYALNQRLAGDATLFNGENDIVYYRMVADSVSVYNPTSPYLKTLQNVIAEFDNRTALIGKIEEGAANPVSHPDIELKDMYGRTQTLDNNLGEATLLVFTLMLTEDSAPFNAELKRLHEDYSDRGLSIYHISLDSDRTLWLNAVQEQRLPWTSVIDERGENAPSLSLYNVTELPTIYLLDNSGNVVGKNLNATELTRQLNELL